MYYVTLLLYPKTSGCKNIGYTNSLTQSEHVGNVQRIAFTQADDQLNNWRKLFCNLNISEIECNLIVKNTHNMDCRMTIVQWFSCKNCTLH